LKLQNEKNAKRLAANVHFFTSDLLQNITQQYNAIVANLPYVDQNWQRSPETNFEPSQALFAQNDGLALIKNLLLQAPKYLVADGFLLLEADPRQFAAIEHFATGFTVVHSVDYTMLLKKITN
jgi:methylase of polypeptide subunit release factors